MRGSARYVSRADAFAEFMVLIMVQAAVSAVAIASLAVRRALLVIRLIEPREIEGSLLFWGLIFGFIAGSGPWMQADTIFWNDNPKLGGQPYWFISLLLAVVWATLTSASILVLTEPRVINDGMRRYRQGR